MTIISGRCKGWWPRRSRPASRGSRRPATASASRDDAPAVPAIRHARPPCRAQGPLVEGRRRVSPEARNPAARPIPAAPDHRRAKAARLSSQGTRWGAPPFGQGGRHPAMPGAKPVTNDCRRVPPEGRNAAVRPIPAAAHQRRTGSAGSDRAVCRNPPKPGRVTAQAPRQAPPPCRAQGTAPWAAAEFRPRKRTPPSGQRRAASAVRGDLSSEPPEQGNITAQASRQAPRHAGRKTRPHGPPPNFIQGKERRRPANAGSATPTPRRFGREAGPSPEPPLAPQARPSRATGIAGEPPREPLRTPRHPRLSRGMTAARNVPPSHRPCPGFTPAGGSDTLPSRSRPGEPWTRT